MSSEDEYNILAGDGTSRELNLGERLPYKDLLKRAGKNLEVAWSVQLKMLSGRNAAKLGATPQEYERELEEMLKEDFVRKAKSVEDISSLLIVETRIALPEMLKIAHIDTFFDPQEVEDWLVEGGFQTPNKPYIAHLTYVSNKSVNDVRFDSLRKENRRGGTVFEGITFYQRDPRILNELFLKFPGSQVGLDNCPFLFTFSGNNPLLSYGNVDSASPKFACVIASKI